MEAEQFPQHLSVTFAFRAVLESREQRPEHMLRVRLAEPEGRSLGHAEVLFTLAEGESIVSGEEAAVSVPVSLTGFAVDSPGLYVIDATFDQRNVGTFPFRVNPIE
jgi:hypothetical protein